MYNTVDMNNILFQVKDYFQAPPYSGLKIM